MAAKIEGFDFVNSDQILFVTSTGAQIRCPDGDRGVEEMLERLLSRHDVLVFETIDEEGFLNGNVENASWDHYLYLRALLDMGFTERYGRKKTILARFDFPSTQMCSTCQRVGRVSRNARKWTCRSCNTTHQRDVNAARNLKRVGRDYLRGHRSDVEMVYPADRRR